ncbi:BZ3500_MvSof-1268-A1-R1_Chr1-3g02075 [Microbotryum saponariae]|uniref:BZ3500_MvSof-1268-A1-R1_Chr1-3g02075 protein n=1 Tax=Microbotryum saponariae TaxID=289078 RepID=A0A2X0MF96_9BASI|nr:BZ3500_MvSof-1268-A1-R1_Chr1-3g02075 [Microbotryum saponariae]SCZ95337.1 BZ3501_MvSof-1269-A2-R1_Chr1-3g01677 [Microbotryum saponariae]
MMAAALAVAVHGRRRPQAGLTRYSDFQKPVPNFLPRKTTRTAVGPSSIKSVRSEACHDPSQDERRAVPRSATVVLAMSGRGELTVADVTLLPTSTTYRLGAASMRYHRPRDLTSDHHEVVRISAGEGGTVALNAYAADDPESGACRDQGVGFVRRDDDGISSDPSSLVNIHYPLAKSGGFPRKAEAS